jgi:phosphate uptake regulator
MRRKVIQHGPSSLTISLPHTWVKENNLKKGDEVNLEQEGDAIRVYSGKERLFSKKIVVDLSDLDSQSAKIMLSVIHKSGYDEVEVKFRSPDTIKILQERINSRLIGYEIVDQKGSSCIIKSVASDHLAEFDSLMRRAFLVTISLSENGLSLMKKLERDALKEILILEETNNKIVNYCQRLLNKSPNKNEHTIYSYVVLKIVENVCDDYRDLVACSLNCNKPISSESLILFEKVNGLFMDYYKLFYEYSDSRFTGIQKSIASLRREFRHESSSSKEYFFRQYLGSIVERVFDGLGSAVGIHH